MQLHKSLILSSIIFLLLVGLPGLASANVINLTGYAVNGNNCGQLDLVATVNNSPSEVEFGYSVDSGDWQTIGSDTWGQNGWSISWDSGAIYSWDVRVRARTVPDGIWFTSASFKMFNLTTNSITGLISPASGVVNLNTTYSGPAPVTVPDTFPEGTANYIISTSYLRYTSSGLATTEPGTISTIRTNFQGSGTLGITFQAYAPGPSTTAIQSTSPYTVGVGLQSFPVNMSNVPVGSLIGFYISTYTTSTLYVIYYAWATPAGNPMPSYGSIWYGQGASGTWYTTTSYQGPAIEFTIQNPYVDFQGIDFGYKDSTTGTPHVIGPGVNDGNGNYSIAWNTAVTNQEIGSDRIYVGTRAYNKTVPSGWNWQGPYTVVNTVNVQFTNSLNSGEIIVDDRGHDVVYSTTWTFLDSHTISSPLYQNETETDRYVFNQWMHGGTRTQTVKFVSATTRNFYAMYTPQFYYQATTPYSTISNSESGWYDNNSNIRSIVEEFVIGSEGERYACVGWNGTGSIGNGTTYDTGIFQLTEATTVAFLWSKQYYLTVSNSLGATLGDSSGWYVEGQTLSSYVESPVQINSMERWYCIGWTGEGSIDNGEFSYSGEFPIVENTEITWNWARQYRLVADKLWFYFTCQRFVAFH